MIWRGGLTGGPAGDGILSFGDHGLFASPTLSRGAGRIKHPTTHDQNPVEQDDGYVLTPAQRWKGHAAALPLQLLPHCVSVDQLRNTDHPSADEAPRTNMDGTD